MKNKVFNVWIKELTSIVFTQALQALVLAVLMSVVVGLFLASKADGANTTNYAIGVYAIIAMMSLSKIELLVKRIFGIGPATADVSMKGGGRDLLKTGIALKMGGRLLNNVPKVAAGVGGLLIGQGAARRRVRNAQQEYDEYKKQQKMDKDKEKLNGGKGTTAASNRIASKSSALTADDLASALKKSNKKNPKNELRDAKDALNKERRENLSKITGGVLETAGAFGGGIIGAEIGMAMGDDVLQNALIGAGVGDAIGEVANTPMSLYDYAMIAHEKNRNLNQEYKENKSKVKQINSQYKDHQKMMKENKKEEKEHNKEVKRRAINMKNLRTEREKNERINQEKQVHAQNIQNEKNTQNIKNQQQSMMEKQKAKREAQKQRQKESGKRLGNMMSGNNTNSSNSNDNSGGATRPIQRK